MKPYVPTEYTAPPKEVSNRGPTGPAVTASVEPDTESEQPSVTFALHILFTNGKELVLPARSFDFETDHEGYINQLNIDYPDSFPAAGARSYNNNHSLPITDGYLEYAKLTGIAAIWSEDWSLET